MPNVTIDQLANEISNAVRDYTEDVSAAISYKMDEIAQCIIVEAAMNAPRREGGGEYARSFVITAKDEYGRTKRFIWNRKFYRLVHLLEFGHAKLGGGRVRAYPHLIPAYLKYSQQIPYHMRRIIERGGDV